MSALCLGPCRPDAHGGPRQTRGGRLCDVCRERMWEHLQQITEAWEDLTARLAREGSSAMSEKVGGSKEPGLVLNDKVSDVMRDVTAWLWFVTRVIMEEKKGAVEPTNQTPPGLARWIGRSHVDWIATHPDEQLVADIAGEAKDHASKCRRAAYPTGARRLDLPEVRCVDHSTGEDGSRLPCGGTMFVVLVPQSSVMPDLVCSEDEAHRVEPSTWARPQWRRQLDPDAAVALARRIAG